MERDDKDFEIAFEEVDCLETEISQQELELVMLYFADFLQEMMKKEEKI